LIELNATLFIQFANFFLLIFILNMLLFRPLRKVLRERREVVEGSHATADSLASKITAKMAEYEARLAEAKVKGNDEKNQLRTAALEEEKTLLDEAQDMAGQKRTVIRKQISKEMTGARKILKSEADALGQEVASKVLGRAV
jgi:F-type H+-transporting ATPase subunit b